jgi:hypothetical protein
MGRMKTANSSASLIGYVVSATKPEAVRISKKGPAQAIGFCKKSPFRNATPRE